LRYKYYDYHNKTPILTFKDFVQLDSFTVPVIRRNLTPQYRKENASAELVWRPRKNFTVGVTSAWEQYDRDRRDADVTNEYTGKAFIDTAPTDWLRVRTSYLQAMRRYRNYDFAKYVGIPGDPFESFLYQNMYMRKFDLANRGRKKAEISAEIRPDEKVAITPSLGWRNDGYGDTSGLGGQLGLKRDISWNAGVEVAYSPSRSASITVAYMFESIRREMVNNLLGAFGTTTDFNWGSKISDRVHTVTVAANVNVIPKKWDLKFAYMFSQATSNTDTYPLGAFNVTSSPKFPDVINRYHRAEATSKYILDSELVKKLGWTGDEVSFTTRYVLERNSITNWHWDEMTPYMLATDPSAFRSLFLAAIDPNYWAHFAAFSVGFKW
jgi:hypothetical protein